MFNGSSTTGRTARTNPDRVYPQLPALISATAVLILGMSTYLFVTLGPLSRHMGVHVALMNVAAPLCAAIFWVAWPAHRKWQASGKTLWPAAIGQMVLLWASHVPAVHALATMSSWLQALLHVSLFCSALLFWHSVIPSSGVHWQSIMAMLVTGKVACLLGALLAFSPRLLYPAPTGDTLQHAVHHAAHWPDLADQQLAGLLMIAACPLSYVLAGVVLAAQFMTDLGRGARVPSDCNIPAVR